MSIGLSFVVFHQDGTEKRTKDTYGPPMGKRLMVFLDDLNMPRMDQYGTQQPIALLRLLIDRKVKLVKLYRLTVTDAVFFKPLHQASLAQLGIVYHIAVCMLMCQFAFWLLSLP